MLFNTLFQRSSRLCRIAVLFIAAAISLDFTEPASAAVMYFPGVTEQMSKADYWVRNDPDADTVLMDINSINLLNQQMKEDPACCMYDLENFEIKKKDPKDIISLIESMAESAYKEISDYAENGKYYIRSGDKVDMTVAEQIKNIILQTDPESFQTVLYGIAVKRTDLRAYPTEEIITDEKGDIDFDYVQLSGIAVNDPVVITGKTTDGKWYNCRTDNCSGWIRASDIAVCRNKQEWLSAWKIPDDRVLVVTENRFALDQSNTTPELSGLILTMGTILERADGIGPMGTRTGERITNRAAYQNHVVWIPTRNEDGSYRKEKALISERHDVHEGYLPMTRRNILKIAMNALGDAYGWGGMLSAEDCSGFMHAIYACFGMRLPRNTTWQSASPLFRYDLNYLPDTEKLEVIRSLPAGSILYFRGHAMLYLGEEKGNAYVLSSVSSMMDPHGSGRLRVRSVVINDLNILRANGNSWLRSLDTAVIPYFSPGEPGIGFHIFSDGIRYRRPNGNFAVMNWQEIGNDWYYFDQNGLMTVNRWIQARDETGVWYYTGADGKMIKNTVIDGYTLSQDGTWREGQ